MRHDANKGKINTGQGSLNRYHYHGARFPRLDPWARIAGDRQQEPLYSQCVSVTPPSYINNGPINIPLNNYLTLEQYHISETDNIRPNTPPSEHTELTTKTRIARPVVDP